MNTRELGDLLDKEFKHAGAGPGWKEGVDLGADVATLILGSVAFPSPLTPADIAHPATDDGTWPRFYCFFCGKVVSTPIPRDTIMRGTVECPECCEEQGARDERERKIAASYLRGHAEEALDSTTRAALFWAAEHIESGDHLAQEAPPKKEEK